MYAIETRDLCKTYGLAEVLHGVKLAVPAGSIFGFLGPNGAGKTTTIRILTGLLRASSGEARVLGRDAWKDGPELRRHVGYLPGDVRLYEHMTGRALLDFFNAARQAGASGEIERLARRFELNLDKRVRNYSRGMKQKLGLIQAMFHRPQLLVLDEPTISLDPLIRNALNDELKRVAAEGRTVLFSSHTLPEVEEICDRVAILRDGRLIEQDTIDALRSRAVRHVEVTLNADVQLGLPPNGLTIKHQTNGRLSATWVGTVAPLLDWLARAPVRDLAITPPSLEDLFLAYYSEDSAGVRR